MAFAISQLPDEPIIIVTVDLPLDRHLDSFRSTNEQLNHFAATGDELLYVVFDLRGEDVTFSDVIIGVDELDSDPASWIKYPRVILIAVGQHPVLEIAIKRVGQQFHVEMPRFTTLDEALVFIRASYDTGSPSDQPDPDN